MWGVPLISIPCLSCVPSQPDLWWAEVRIRRGFDCTSTVQQKLKHPCVVNTSQTQNIAPHQLLLKEKSFLAIACTATNANMIFSTLLSIPTFQGYLFLTEINILPYRSHNLKEPLCAFHYPIFIMVLSNTN